MSGLNNQEILEKAIRKAVDDGGWSWVDFFSTSTHGKLRYKGAVEEVVSQMLNDNTWPVLTFNHDFAKALWSNDLEKLADKHDMYYFPLWQYHLQQMVIADDPVKYLEANI